MSTEREKTKRFEEAMLPHLDAAYDLARWLLRTDDAADDIVQESFLRAFKYFDGFRGENGRAWLLKIVRNSCYTWLRQNRAHDSLQTLDEETQDLTDCSSTPDVLTEQLQDSELLHQALDVLPAEFREAIVLRELEGFSYKEIAEIASIPLGTVMSRLARARKQLLREIVKRRT
jgi:RNA polymerase sigma-70 factor, ECF subfamily